MDGLEFAGKILKVLERIAKALEKMAKDEPSEDQRAVKGFNPGGTD